ncbi:hypothetical protein O6P43_034326 [Quillaja saponaria]|uniref:Uncharacterized protein n=1 Tax=Quillaja saponaria TaxID=32244 RepID=A0AAD7P7H6_QUISA|nr:hypothetical protein O6P43_034326 [Quillaja saponaria]
MQVWLGVNTDCGKLPRKVLFSSAEGSKSAWFSLVSNPNEVEGKVKGCAISSLSKISGIDSQTISEGDAGGGTILLP